MQDTAYQTLEVVRDGALATVWLNRPDVRNAFNETTIAEITKVFRALDGDPQVRAGHDDERQARLLAAHAIALQFGWGLMAPTLRVAFGLNNLSDAEIRAAVADQAAKIVAPQ